MSDTSYGKQELSKKKGEHDPRGRVVDTAEPEKSPRIDRGEVPSSNPYKTAGKSKSGREV